MADSVTSLASARAVVDNYIPKHERDGTNPLLLALLDHAPTEQGQLNICRRILECEEGANDKHHTAERLKGLADWYKFGLLVPMKTQGCRTPRQVIVSPGRNLRIKKALTIRLLERILP
ncbi:unnamed protein product [Rhizoctonia solani]|uniref:Uncharacterized protein n=1 Tax=Rhizoctonia solani TaxID=456999 RepID=A0A8H3AAN8_9AGAM|nr:unnamed protein product [Rhizoctonia solani]